MLARFRFSPIVLRAPLALGLVACGPKNAAPKSPPPVETTAPQPAPPPNAAPDPETIPPLSPESGETVCAEPRSEMCTREYRPVCATIDTGVRCVRAPCPESQTEKTYGNACSACAEPKVIRHRPGACAGEGG